jgi:hypothetical protein
MKRTGFRSFAGGIDGESLRRWAVQCSVLALLLALALLGSAVAVADDVESWDESTPEGGSPGDEPPAEPAEGAVGGCPAGEVDVGRPGERRQCRAACPDGQQYNELPDGRLVCGPACGSDATPTNEGTCRCVREGATFDAATGTCGCPAGQIDVSRPGERMQCRTACPEGQQYNELPDGGLVCGPACGPDSSPTSNGSCRCLRIGATFDPATGTCGCPAGQVDVSRPGERMQCRAACPEGQQYNESPNGRMVCGPACGPDALPANDGSCRCRRVGATFDPATSTCGCPAGQVDVSRPGERMQCRPPCPEGQQYKQLPDGRVVCRPT